MKTPHILTYDEVRAELGSGRSHLLLGNGFSIACDPRFNYRNLLQYAKDNGLPERVVAIFEKLGTNNFEGVMRLLEDAFWVVKHYGLAEGANTAKAKRLKTDLEAVKTSLVDAIAKTHLDHTHQVKEERKTRCASFLEPYYNIFSLNYDLLLYWVEMHALERLAGRDGFREDVNEPDATYVVFSEHIGGDKGIFFIHGALHLYVVNGEVRKHTWSRTQTHLIEGIREAMKKGHYALFVAEGTADKKLEQIQRSGYLSYCLGKLERIENALVVFGISFGESDRHITDVIAQNQKLKTLYVGVFGDPASSANQEVIKHVTALEQRRKKLLLARRVRTELSINFFDSATVPVWDKCK